jgi:hypothetical protein
VTKDIPTPLWITDHINFTKIDKSPADLCILSAVDSDTLMSMTWCQNCSAGSFQSKSGTTYCELCPVDSYSSTNGSTACDTCQEESHIYQPAGGPIIPQISQSQCQSNCPPGTYTSIELEDRTISNCMPCIPGSFSAERDAKQCLPCEHGKFSSQFATQSCALCPVGKGTESMGSNRSEQCLGAARKINSFPECRNQVANENETLSNSGFVDNIELNVVSSPLHRLQQRILGTADINEQNINVSLDESTLQDQQHLLWFLQQAVGLNQLNLQNSSCSSKERANYSGPQYTNPVSRTMQCTGRASVWGYSKFTRDLHLRRALPAVSVVFVEVTTTASPILHMALLLLDYNQSEKWSPFLYTGLPLFDGIPKDSWVHNLGFGGDWTPLNILAVQASTCDFDFHGCEICTGSINFGGETLMSQSRFPFKKGFALYSKGAHIRKRTDHSFQLLGLEHFMPKV